MQTISVRKNLKFVIWDRVKANIMSEYKLHKTAYLCNSSINKMSVCKTVMLPTATLIQEVAQFINWYQKNWWGNIDIISGKNKVIISNIDRDHLHSKMNIWTEFEGPR